MRVAVMTWLRQNDYGSVLQAAALQRVLCSMGHEASLIGYEPNDKVFTVPSGSVYREMAGQIRENRRYRKNPLRISEASSGQFADFMDRYVRITKVCHTLTDLESLNTCFDAFVCGSDRIWSASTFDSHFFLDFVNDPNRLVAYAPSILDIESADIYVTRQMEKLIRRFRHLSVREDTGRKLLAGYLGGQALEAADPTLLLNGVDWDDFVREELDPERVPDEVFSREDAEKYRQYEEGRIKALALRAEQAEPEIESTTVQVKAAAVDETQESMEADAEGAKGAKTADIECAAGEVPEKTAGESTEAADKKEEMSCEETDGASSELSDSKMETETTVAEKDDAPATDFDEIMEPYSIRPYVRGEQLQKDKIETPKDSENTADVLAAANLNDAPKSLEALDPQAVISKGNTADTLNTDDTMKVPKPQEESRPEDEPPSGYLLISFQSINRTYWDAAYRIAERLNLVVRIVPRRKADLRRKGAISGPIGPLEYVRLIRNAAYVCTDSYHATTLAIDYKREFCCFLRYEGQDEEIKNARIHYILDMVGLSSRLYDPDQPMEPYLKKIDFMPVEYKADALRLKSRQFLEDALTSIQTYLEQTEQKGQHVLEGFSLCCGCAACEAQCEQQAITVRPDQNGFLRAFVDEERCIRCGRCTAVCPFRETGSGKSLSEGRVLSYSDEEDVFRENAASGGLAGRLMQVLHQAGFAVAACLYDEKEKRVRHELVLPDQENGMNLLEKMKGVLYVQSDFSEIIETVRRLEIPTVIIGTPCQIAGARAALQERDQVWYIDVNCSGVPSPHLFEKYRKDLQGHSEAEPNEWSVRFQATHPSRAGRYVAVRAGDKLQLLPQKKDSFMRLYRTGACLAPSCYECRFHMFSCADLRVGDWDSSGLYNRPDEQVLGGYVLERNTKAGKVSSAVCLTEHGKKMLDELMIAGWWEGLHKKDSEAFFKGCERKAMNPIKPVYYDDLQKDLMDDETSLKKIIREYVRPIEKRRTAASRLRIFYRNDEGEK